jgi:addiction module RelE/StbE family toxin
MQYFLSKNFEKKFSKLSKKIKEKTVDQLEIFIVDPMDTRLNNHALSGKWKEYRSINITGNYRAVYKTINEDFAQFIDIDTHPKLYK